MESLLTFQYNLLVLALIALVQTSIKICVHLCWQGGGAVMKIRDGVSRIIGGFTGLAFLGMAASAQASLLWEFESTGTDLSGTGSFEVSTDSSTTGSVLAFSFSGQIFGHDWSCTGCGIVGAQNGFFQSWEIDNNWNITSVRLTSSDFVSNDGDIEAGIDLVQFSDIVQSNCSTESGTDECGGLAFNRAEGALTLSPIHEEIPEPASLTLILIALVGLGLLRRGVRLT